MWPLCLRSCHSLALDLTPSATSLHWATAQRLLETERRGNNCPVKRQASDSRQESHPEAFLQHCASSPRGDPTGKDGGAGSPGPTANCRRQRQAPRRSPARRQRGECHLRPLCSVGTLRPWLQVPLPSHQGCGLSAVSLGEAPSSFSCAGGWGSLQVMDNDREPGVLATAFPLMPDA